MIRLEFIGKDVMRRNWKQVLEMTRAQYPHLTETSIEHIASDMMRQTKGPDGDSISVGPRIDQENLVAWGRDVFAENPETMEAWPLLTPIQRDTVLQGKCRFYPTGLSKTYVWCKQNDFVQEVSDADAELIRKATFIAGWFQNPEVYGPYTPVRTFDYEVAEEHEFNDLTEARRYERDIQGTKQWNGV